MPQPGLLGVAHDDGSECYAFCCNKPPPPSSPSPSPPPSAPGNCWDGCDGQGPCDGWCGQGHACCRTGVFTLGCPATACDGYHCCVQAVPFPAPPPPSPPPPPACDLACHDSTCRKLWAAGLQCADTLDLCGQACSACCRSADDPASLAPMQRAAQRLVAEGDAAAREPQGLIGARALLLGAAAAAVLSAAVLRRRAANARAAPSPDLPTRRRRREVRHPLF